MEKTKTQINEVKESGNNVQRTAFAMPQFIVIVESLQKVMAEIDKLISRYDEGDKRRLILIEMRNTITQDLYNKLEGVVGSDFLECSKNVFSPCKD